MLSLPWTSWTRPQRLLVAFGAATALSAVAHVLVWLAVGMPSLIGPVTWRKPIVFGLSIAVLSWSLAWVVRLLPDDERLRRQTIWLVVLLTLELLLIDMQQWRGVGSHFNVATPFDAIVFNAMGLLIVAAALILAWWTWRLFRDHRRDSPVEQVTAARAGMLLLAVGSIIGIGLAVWGNAVQATSGSVPTTLGAAGNLKVTHAIALHALQVLPLLAVALAAVPHASLRVAAMRRAVAGYTLVLAWALWQACSGRAPEHVVLPSALLLAAGGALVASAALTALAARMSTTRAHQTEGDLR